MRSRVADVKVACAGHAGVRAGRQPLRSRSGSRRSCDKLFSMRMTEYCYRLARCEAEREIHEQVEEFKRVVQGLKGNEDAESLAGKLGLSGGT